MIIVRVIKSARYVVAVCDSELLGKKFEEGKFQLDVKESFFLGEEMNEEEAILVMNRMSREDATFYIAGKDSINAALKAGIIEKDSIKKIQNIPYTLILL
ncbi:Uncharacterised protein [uncultured archaeon]|nr:Uncharacterised protein [uncultured archaeon]